MPGRSKAALREGTLAPSLCSTGARARLGPTFLKQNAHTYLQEPTCYVLEGALWASKPLRPRGGFDLKTFRDSRPKILRSKPPRCLKRGPAAKIKNFCCTFLRGGATKRTASPPSVEGGAVVSSFQAPGGPQKICQRHPLW